MKLFTRQSTPTEELKNAAIEAALSALGDGKSESKDKPAMTGVRAVAAGAVLYTAGRAAFRGRRFLNEQFSSDQAEDYAATQTREEREDPEADGRRDEDAGAPDDGSRSKTATPPLKRKPMRRAARNNPAEPSLELPQQRWPRMAAARK